jgi:hypothetical protein
MSGYIRLYTYTDRQTHICIDSNKKYQLFLQSAATYGSL